MKSVSLIAMMKSRDLIQTSKVDMTRDKEKTLAQMEIQD